MKNVMKMNTEIFPPSLLCVCGKRQPLPDCFGPLSLPFSLADVEGLFPLERPPPMDRTPSPSDRGRAVPNAGRQGPWPVSSSPFSLSPQTPVHLSYRHRGLMWMAAVQRHLCVGLHDNVFARHLMAIQVTIMII